MYNFSSLNHNIDRKVSLSTWITTSSAKHIRMVLTACICNCFQSCTSMVVGFSSHKRASINPCWMSTPFTLTCHKEKLLFPSNLLIFTLIVLVFSIFYLDHHRRNLYSGTTFLWYQLLYRIRYHMVQQKERRNKIRNTIQIHGSASSLSSRGMQALLQENKIKQI